MLISVELILNGAGLNLVALNRFVAPDNADGVVFTLFIMGSRRLRLPLPLELYFLIFKRFRHIEGGKLEEMKDLSHDY